MGILKKKEGEVSLSVLVVNEAGAMNGQWILLFEGPLKMAYNCKHDKQFSARC